LSNANRLNEEGIALPDAYVRIMEDINGIDVFKSLFPPEEQKRLTFLMENSHGVSPGAVDWQVLQQATTCAWKWILHELLDVARKEGRHNFLGTRESQVCSSLRNDPSRLNSALSRLRKKVYMCGNGWSII
jgi:hypothetical protein